MKLFPAIDLYQGQAVRLYQGDYHQMTVYSTDPAALAADFHAAGADYLHVVDLEGAREGGTPNLPVIRDIVQTGHLATEVGGGIRTLAAIDKFLTIGVKRVILGTAAITKEGFVEEAIRRFGTAAIAVSMDLRDGFLAIKGWTEVTTISGEEFCRRAEALGVSTIICTDISRDGAMQGPNTALYERLSRAVSIDIIASGGISSTADIRALAQAGLAGAILGKALYTGAVSLQDALAAASAADAKAASAAGLGSTPEGCDADDPEGGAAT